VTIGDTSLKILKWVPSSNETHRSPAVPTKEEKHEENTNDENGADKENDKHQAPNRQESQNSSVMSMDDSIIGYSESSQDASMSQSMMDTATNDSIGVTNGATTTTTENTSQINGIDNKDDAKGETPKAQLPAPPNVSALLENSSDAQFPDECQKSTPEEPKEE